MLHWLAAQHSVTLPGWAWLLALPAAAALCFAAGYAFLVLMFRSNFKW